CRGRTSSAGYGREAAKTRLAMRAGFPRAELAVERHLQLQDRALHCKEIVQNLSSVDRPIGWTQHVTLGPPFLEKGVTEFRASATRSRVYEGAFGVADYLAAAATFDWPSAPRSDGGVADLRRFTDRATSSAYTAPLIT